MNRSITLFILFTILVVSGCGLRNVRNGQHEVVELGAPADPNVQKIELPDATVFLRVRENRWPASDAKRSWRSDVEMQIWDDQVRYSQQSDVCNEITGCAKCSGCCIGFETSAKILPRTEPIMTETATTSLFIEGFGESGSRMIWMMSPTRHIIRSTAQLLVWSQAGELDQYSCDELGTMEHRDSREYHGKFLSLYDLHGPQSQFMTYLSKKLQVNNYVTWQMALHARALVYRYINAKLGCITDKSARDEALRKGDELLAGYGAIKI